KPFDGTTLVAFARFSFLMRLGAIRVLHEDLRGLEEDLQELESRGVSDVDGVTVAGLRKASIVDLRNLCEKWKHYFPGKYSQNQWFTDVIGVRCEVKRTLEETRNRATSASTRNEAAPRRRTTVGAENSASPIVPAPDRQTELREEVERYMRQIAEQVQSPI